MIEREHLGERRFCSFDPVTGAMGLAALMGTTAGSGAVAAVPSAIFPSAGLAGMLGTAIPTAGAAGQAALGAALPAVGTNLVNRGVNELIPPSSPQVPQAPPLPAMTQGRGFQAAPGPAPAPMAGIVSSRPAGGQGGMSLEQLMMMRRLGLV